MRAAARVALGVLALALPFAAKPVHIDDANFLVLARGAAADPWRPHAISINWQGTTERAFDVLSNPPGVAWWLAPVAAAPAWVAHLWMLPWVLLGVWGAFSAGERLAGRGAAAAWLGMAGPLGLLAAGSLTPDLPLLACAWAGVALVVGGRPGWGGLVLGAAGLFRYSGLVLIPVAGLLAAAGAGGGRAALGPGLRAAAAAALPLGLLALHDLHAYGRWHLLAMTGFQAVSTGPAEVAHKGLAALGSLGLLGLPPVLARGVGARLGWALGLVLGLGAAFAAGHLGAALLGTVVAVGAGAAALGGLPRPIRAEERALWAWALLGFAFLLTLRFAAARYWLPFLPPLVLLAVRAAPPRALAWGVPVVVGWGLLVAGDDLAFALAQRDLAARVHAAAGAPGRIAGHWGFQHHLEAAGWSAHEDDAALPAGVPLARSAAAWPQEVAGCVVETGRFDAPAVWPFPRVHTRAGAANAHSFLVAGDPPLPVFSPVGWGADPYDTVTLWRACDAEPDAARAPPQ